MMAYNWEILDTMIDEAVAENKQISFRVYTMRGEDYGGHQLPEWVLEAGAEILPQGEVDYSNCTYQSEWAGFVQVLQERYDGNPAIAFIDISGYGNFNEWGWSEAQTEWDDLWGSAYGDGIATPADMETLDSQARRRLADMFMGASFAGHQCRTASVGGEILTVDYDYAGFQDTQLIMPYAGTRQSTQYVFSQRPNVGFRYDCLGREASDTRIMEKVGDEIEGIWRNAPVVFELCNPDNDDFYEPAYSLLQAAHGSIVHDNIDDEGLRDKRALSQLMRYVGYRYFLSEATFTSQLEASDELELQMIWQNTGYAPAYPRMGQDFHLRLYLIDENNEVAIELDSDENIANWMPADPIGEPPPENSVSVRLSLSDISVGTYQLQVAIINQRTGEPLRLAIVGQDHNGRFTIGSVEID
ncbi:MAG: DUF4832 domain-containing protein [Anaerolineae bacterium]|nr:DUF4832 domain-containing protein [Anaerolineae bacterium]